MSSPIESGVSTSAESPTTWRAPDPLRAAAELRAVFGSSEFPLRAAAATRSATVGRTLAELTHLLTLGMLDSTCPGRFWCTEPVGIQQVLDPLEMDAARSRAERWYIAAARTAALLLPAGALPAALTGDLHQQADPTIVDAFSALAWSQHNRPTLLQLSRVAAEAGRHETVIDLAFAAIPAAMADGSVDTWLEFAEHAVDGARALGDRPSEAMALEHLGTALCHCGVLAMSEHLQTEALQVRRQLGDTSGVVISTIALGLVHQRAAAPREARAWFEQALQLVAQAGDDVLAAVARENLASAILEVTTHETEIGTVLGLLGDATVHYRRTQSAPQQANCRTLTAAALRAAGARTHGLHALAVAHSGADAVDAAAKPARAAHHYAEVGRCLLALDQPAEARQWFSTAAALLHASGDTVQQQRLRDELASCIVCGNPLLPV